jgi:hypothetical protein
MESKRNDTVSPTKNSEYKEESCILTESAAFDIQVFYFCKKVLGKSKLIQEHYSTLHILTLSNQEEKLYLKSNQRMSIKFTHVASIILIEKYMLKNCNFFYSFAAELTIMSGLLAASFCGTLYHCEFKLCSLTI